MDTLIAPCRGCGTKGFGVRDGLCARCGKLSRRGDSLPLERREQSIRARKAMTDAERRAHSRAKVEDPARAARLIQQKLRRMEGEEAIEAEAAAGGAASDDDDEDEAEDNNKHNNNNNNNNNNKNNNKNNTNGKSNDNHDNFAAARHVFDYDAQAPPTQSAAQKQWPSAAAQRLAMLKQKLAIARTETGAAVRTEERRLADPNAEKRRVAEARNEARKSREGGGAGGGSGGAPTADVGPTALDCERVILADQAKAARRAAISDGADYYAYETHAAKVNAARMGTAPKQITSVDPADIYRELNGGSVNVDGVTAERGPSAREARKTRGEAIASMAALATAKKRADTTQGISRRAKKVRKGAIDHVNDPNRRYNNALDQAYGQSTAETKQALERGTAL
jgi:hypothetical protein